MSEMMDSQILKVCDDLLLNNKDFDKYDAFCLCKHTIEHMGWNELEYHQALGYIAKKLGLEK